MARADWIRGYRVVFAVATIFTMIYQFNHGRNTIDDFRTANFLSFFTIQVNTIASVVFLIGGLTSLGLRPTRTWDLIRGAAVTYIAVGGVAYGVLLTGYQEEVQTTLPWVDTMLHRVMPIAVVVEWFLFPVLTRIKFREALVWLVYPLIYLIYSLIRGPRVDWWPYPFLNPHHESQGYGVVAIYCFFVFLGFVGFVWSVSFLTRRSSNASEGSR